MVDHTKLPWRNACFQILGADGSKVTHTGMGNLPPSRSSESEANAVFIVKACNSHDALVAAIHAIEFRGHQGKCPLCAGWNMSPSGETPGRHTKDCLIGKALAQVKP